MYKMAEPFGVTTTGCQLENSNVLIAVVVLILILILYSYWKSSSDGALAEAKSTMFAGPPAGRPVP